MNVLVTGGAGYIGSHTIVELLNTNHKVIVIDNLSNSSRESIERIKKITKTDFPFYEADVRDEGLLDNIFKENKIDAVIHFAGLKAVGESVENPILYYENNVGSTISLLKVMRDHEVKKVIFSSSATVYGDPKNLPIKETDRASSEIITNAYGRSKYMIEEMLKDVAISDKDFEITILRYFNPIGAHESGLIGEDPNGEPNNLLPYIAQVAVGRLKKVRVFSNDYPTKDGTGVRDYIHVVDLARGHVAALEHSKPGVEIYNLGTGEGTSVLELINSFIEATGKDIPYEIVSRRPGDIPMSYASSDKANEKLEWRAGKNVLEACEDCWRWQSKNPNGFKD